MSENLKYPFELINSFFISLSFSRDKEVPQPIELPTQAEISFAEREFPIVQIGLRIKSEEGKAISFDVHLVGLFEYKGDKKEFDDKLRELERDFALERGIALLWSNIGQLVKVTTAQMGISPLNLRMPLDFGSKEELMKRLKDPTGDVQKESPA